MRFKFPVLLAITALSFGLTTLSSKKHRHKLTTPVFVQNNEVMARQMLDKLTLEEKIAQFFMVASWPNRDEEHQQEIENLVKN